MHNWNNQRCPDPVGTNSRCVCERRAHLGRTCASIVFVAAFACLAQNGLTPPGSAQALDGVNAQTPVNRPPDANAQMQSPENKAKENSLENATTERKKQITEDSTKLLTMAIALKAEVDKTTKDTLSLNVIRKADEIEKLAHSVKEKMKLTVGGNN